MRSLWPCSDSSATPSFPSPLIGQVVAEGAQFILELDEVLGIHHVDGVLVLIIAGEVINDLSKLPPD